MLQAREGDANVARTALTLPKTTLLDQSHIKTICTRVQLAANTARRARSTATRRRPRRCSTGQLKGPVYLASSSNKLPDLLVDLQGQVNIRLRGVISSKGGKLKTTFRTVPDPPVKKFTLEMNGGKKGLLINTSNLCAKKQQASAQHQSPERQAAEEQQAEAASPVRQGEEEGQEVRSLIVEPSATALICGRGRHDPPGRPATRGGPGG